jgi:hypothetical protein
MILLTILCFKGPFLRVIVAVTGLLCTSLYDSSGHIPVLLGNASDDRLNLFEILIAWQFRGRVRCKLRYYIAFMSADGSAKSGRKGRLAPVDQYLSSLP